MNTAQRLKILSDSGKTVFSSKNLQTLWGDNSSTTKIAVKRMLQKGLVVKLAKGYYALNKDYNVYELANLIVSPSYVSCNSALFYHGKVFQVSNIISSVARLNYQKKIRETIFKYYAMKESLFLNLEGIDYKKNLAVAHPERAILDCLYFGLLPNIKVNSSNVNLTFLQELSQLYPKVVQDKISKLLEKLNK